MIYVSILLCETKYNCWGWYRLYPFIWQVIEPPKALFNEYLEVPKCL
jgi:hypothetical protein